MTPTTEQQLAGNAEFQRLVTRLSASIARNAGTGESVWKGCVRALEENPDVFRAYSENAALVAVRNAAEAVLAEYFSQGMTAAGSHAKLIALRDAISTLSQPEKEQAAPKAIAENRMPVWVYEATSRIAHRVDGKCSQAEIASIIMDALALLAPTPEPSPVGTQAGGVEDDLYRVLQSVVLNWEHTSRVIKQTTRLAPMAMKEETARMLIIAHDNMVDPMKRATDLLAARHSRHATTTERGQG